MSRTPSSTEAVVDGSPIRVLIAEDETHLGTILEQFMTARGFFVRIVRDGRSALEQLQTEPFDVALLDVVMPELDGLEVLRLVRERPLPPEIIVITGNGTIETAMAALRLGAYDCLSKPYRMAEIDALVRRAWEKRMLVRDNRYLQLLRQRESATPVFTRYAPLRAVLDMVSKFAPSPLPVLITGEAGTGKHTIAQHMASTRGGAFVRVDCTAFGAHEQVAELAGTGLAAGDDDRAGQRIGALELATRGTLYLHNAEALGTAAQQLLLEALDSGSFVTMSGERRLLDARIIASSTRDLAAESAAGRFSEALMHRLSAMRVSLPPLRDRSIDIPVLAEHFLNPTPAGAVLRLDDSALQALERYAWPGNVRELELVMERAALLARDGVVSLPALGFPTGESAAPAEGGTVSGAVAEPSADDVAAEASPAPSLLALERRHIAEVLERTSWHQGRAAELLGISPKTLYRKIREYGFKRPSGRNP